MRESVVESADSAVQSADYWSRPTGNWPSGYGPLLAPTLIIAQCFSHQTYSNHATYPILTTIGGAHSMTLYRKR